jgi:type IV secretory pathway VirB10-like protein
MKKVILIMTQLSAQVKVAGLSRNKIVVAICVISALLTSALFFGIFASDSDKVQFQARDTKKEVYQNSDTQNSINQILKEAEEGKVKLVASATTLYDVRPNVSANQEVIQQVPPIGIRQAGMEDGALTVDEKAKMQFDKKRIDGKYTSLSSRSLVYSNKPARTINTQTTDGRVRKTDGSTNAITSNNTSTSARDNIGVEDSDNEKVATISTVEVTTTAGKNDTNGVGKTVAEVQSQSAKSQDITNTASIGSSYLDASLETPKSLYEVKAGSVIPATMISGLNSDLPGQITAQVRENIYDTVRRHYLLIPQGSRLIGLYNSNILYGQERILVAWNRLIYPDGSSINLKAMPGTDLEGYSGFHDIVDNKYWKIFGMSFIMGALTGAMQYSQNNTNANVQVGGLGITSNNPTIGQTLSGSLGQQLGQTGLMLAQKNLNVQPTLIIKPNYPFNIMITADMILRPYKKAKYK